MATEKSNDSSFLKGAILGVKVLCGGQIFSAELSQTTNLSKSKSDDGKSSLVTEADLKANAKPFLNVPSEFAVSNSIVLDAFVHSVLEP